MRPPIECVFLKIFGGSGPLECVLCVYVLASTYGGTSSSPQTRVHSCFFRLAWDRPRDTSKTFVLILQKVCSWSVFFAGCCFYKVLVRFLVDLRRPGTMKTQILVQSGMEIQTSTKLRPELPREWFWESFLITFASYPTTLLSFVSSIPVISSQDG